MEPPLEYPAEDVTRLRDSLNELRRILALPAQWTGGEPPRIVSTSLDALLGIATELEERVAQRTRALGMALEALLRRRFRAMRSGSTVSCGRTGAPG